jgi:hypothetical protein
MKALDPKIEPLVFPEFGNWRFVVTGFLGNYGAGFQRRDAEKRGDAQRGQCFEGESTLDKLGSSWYFRR